MAATVLDRAKVTVVGEQPFFASILMKRKLIADDTIPTAGVDQRGQIYYNPAFIESLTLQQAVFLLCHEVGHVIGQHAARRGSRKPKLWNIAGDAWINDMLRDAHVGTFIEGGVNMPGSKDRTVDAIYNELDDKRRRRKQRGNDSGGDQGGDDPGQGEDDDGDDDVGGIGDDLLQRGSPLTQDEAERLDSNMRVELAQAAQAAKKAGKLRGKLAEIVAELLEVRTPWYEILERYMVAMTRSDYSWARPNRRFAPNHYLPSTGKSPKMGEVVIQVDVSGSITEQELRYYNGHMQRILEMCNPERIHVLYTDVRVCKHEVFEIGEEFQLNMYSGGGTDMESGFQFLDAQGIEPEVFVCLTDGYTDFNLANAPAYPVVWCISTDSITAPYGDTVHFEKE